MVHCSQWKSSFHVKAVLPLAKGVHQYHTAVLITPKDCKNCFDMENVNRSVLYQFQLVPSSCWMIPSRTKSSWRLVPRRPSTSRSQPTPSLSSAYSSTMARSGTMPGSRSPSRAPRSPMCWTIRSEPTREITPSLWRMTLAQPQLRSTWLFWVSYYTWMV